MSFGFLGIQFGFALQNANVSRIFQTLGAEIDDLPILWVAAPLTGLLVQPIIGYMSDRTWGPLGRRRPYFLVGAILATAALFVMPNSPVLWVAAGGLNRFNADNETFTRYVPDPDNTTSISSNAVYFLYEDHAGHLWIGPGGGGLNRFDRETGTFTRYNPDYVDPTSPAGTPSPSAPSGWARRCGLQGLDRAGGRCGP